MPEKTKFGSLSVTIPALFISNSSGINVNDCCDPRSPLPSESSHFYQLPVSIIPCRSSTLAVLARWCTNRTVLRKPTFPVPSNLVSEPLTLYVTHETRVTSFNFSYVKLYHHYVVVVWNARSFEIRIGQEISKLPFRLHLINFIEKSCASAPDFPAPQCEGPLLSRLLPGLARPESTPCPAPRTPRIDNSLPRYLASLLWAGS